MPVANANKPVAIWKVDVESVRSNPRDTARHIDQTVGNRDGKIASSEIDAFISANRGSVPGTEGGERLRDAKNLKHYLQSEPEWPTGVAVALRTVRGPMTAFSDWLGKSIMGN